MKTDEIREKDNLGYLQIPKIYESKGFRFEEIENDGNFAIYKQINKSHGATYYIPFVIKRHEKYEIMGNLIEAKCTMPNDEDFGTLAYTEMNLADAQKRLTYLRKYVKKLEQDRLAEKL